MSSGSNGSTKYMLGDAVPIHTNRLSVLGVMGRHQDERRVPYTQPHTPETSRYEPNFMLGHPSEYPRYDHYGLHSGSTTITTTMQCEPTSMSRKKESMYMARPKAYTKPLDPRFLIHPPTPELPRGGFDSMYNRESCTKKMEEGESTVYDPYWHIPRATLWCSHKGCVHDSEPCKDCNWKVSFLRFLSMLLPLLSLESFN